MKTIKYPTWLVPIKTAKKLKNIGFDTETIFLYNKEEEKGKIMFGLNTLEEVDVQSNLEIGQLYFYQGSDMETYECIIPTYEQIFEWFRGKGIHSTLHTYSVISHNTEEFRFYYEINSGFDYIVDTKKYYKTYEECREALVNKLIEIYKHSKDENSI